MSAASRLKLAFLALASAWAAAALAAEGPWQVNPQSQVRLVSPSSAAATSATELELGLHFTTAPGWHVYWKNAGDAGFPPTLALAAAGGGVSGGEILWPAPNRFELARGLMAFGFEGEVLYPVRAQRTAAAGQALDLTAQVDYLVCEVDCVPYHYTLKLRQPLAATAVPDPETAPLFATWRGRLPTPLERAAGVAARGELRPAAANEADLTLHVTGIDPAAGPADLFFASDDAWEASRPRVAAAADGLTFSTHLRARDAHKGLPRPLTVDWTATGLTQKGRSLALTARQSLSAGAEGGDAAAAAAAPERHALPGPVAGFGLAALVLAAAWLLPGGSARRKGLGFLLLAAAVAPLYALSRQVSAEGLASVELTLLGLGLLAWIRAHHGVKPAAAAVLAGAMVLSALAVPWLARRGRLERTAATAPHASTDATPAPPGPARSPRT